MDKNESKSTLYSLYWALIKKFSRLHQSFLFIIKDFFRFFFLNLCRFRKFKSENGHITDKTDDSCYSSFFVIFYFTMSFRKLDFFVKLDNEHRIGTNIGGILSLMTIGLIFALFAVEINSYLHPPIRQRLFVNTSRPTESDNITISLNTSQRAKFFLDITFPRAPCYMMHFDLLDRLSQLEPIYFNRSETFTRLNQIGSPIDTINISTVLHTNRTEWCGNCHNPKLPINICCNTCQDVLRVAKFERVRDLSQCVGRLKELQSMKEEGCNVKIHFETAYIQGEFHISPGYTFYDEEGVHIHDVSSFINGIDLNLTFKINSFRYGDQKSSILDGQHIVQTEKGFFLASYILDILGQNFTAYRHVKTDPETIIPGINFLYDFSAISAELYKDRPPFLHLMSQLLTVIGGVSFILKTLDYSLYRLLNLKKKKELQINSGMI